MVNHIFSVYDEKAEAFYPPFFLPTIGMALREITDCVNDPKHKFGAHPADYTLFQIGVFDDSSGVIVADKKPLGCLIEFKTETPQGELFKLHEINEPELITEAEKS